MNSCYVVCVCVCWEGMGAGEGKCSLRLCESAHGLSEQTRHNARKQESEEDGRRGRMCVNTSKFVTRWRFHTSYRLIESKRILKIGFPAHLPHYQDFFGWKYRIGCQWMNTECTSNFICNPKLIKVDLCCRSKGQESKEKRNRLLAPVWFVLCTVYQNQKDVS